MTWKDFKDAVDKELSDSGFSEDVEVWYIDISFPNEATLSADVCENGLSVY